MPTSQEQQNTVLPPPGQQDTGSTEILTGKHGKNHPRKPSGKENSRSFSQFLIFLMMIVSFGIIGTFPLARFIAPPDPAEVSATATAIALSKPTPTPTPVLFEPGECVSTPANTTYTPKSDPPKQLDEKAQAVWQQANRKVSDYENAQACVAGFIMAYETIDYKHLEKIEDATKMMSVGGKMRFYGKAPGVDPDKRTQAESLGLYQSRKVTATPAPERPVLKDSRFTDGQLHIWLSVKYSLSTTYEGQTTQQTKTRVLLLVSSAPNPQTGGTGWQVSEWRETDAIYTEPNPL
jgi:hypothetical protein